MRLGISPFATTAETAQRLAALATEGGLDTLWLGDGYLTNPDFSGWSGGMETFSTLGWLAGRNPTARIGISAAVLPMRDIPWTAKQANTLHHIAGGGFVLVVAAGFWPQDLEARGVSFARRGSVFDLELDRLVQTLADERYSPGPEHRGAREGGEHGREVRRPRKAPTSKAARSGTRRGVFSRLRHLFAG